MNFLKFNKIVITKVALILNVRKFILYIEWEGTKAGPPSSGPPSGPLSGPPSGSLRIKNKFKIVIKIDI